LLAGGIVRAIFLEDDTKEQVLAQAKLMMLNGFGQSLLYFSTNPTAAG
jgi:hypothetical protein